MGEKTAIAWTDHTFNPWIGCTKVGPGCDHCYAEALDKRHRWGGGVHWGAGVPRYRTIASNWKEPLKWNKAQGEAIEAWYDHTGPKPEPRRVFCASLADVFDNEVPVEWRADLMKLILETPNLSWLLVTKRIGNVLKQVQEVQDYHFDHGDRNIAGRLQDWMKHGIAPDNVRLLITVCNQEEADRDIPKLFALPCKNGVSYEPALGPVDWYSPIWPDEVEKRGNWLNGAPMPRIAWRRLEWIIVGGESTQGSGKARPFDIAWARSTVAQCKAAGVPVFVKQLGSNAQEIAHPAGVSGKEMLRWQRDGWTQIHEGDATHWRKYYRLKDRAGADPAQWPEDLRVQEFPA